MNCQFVRVFRRELVRMVSRRLYFGVCVVLPLFCIFFMSTIFGNGQMENIPVGVVDEDNTSMSREVVRTVEAVPTFKVTHTAMSTRRQPGVLPNRKRYTATS
mgnify:CR=1 FL=1